MVNALWQVVVTLIWLVLSGLAAFLYAPIKAVIGAAIGGGMVGCLLGGRLGRSKLRLPALYGLSLSAWLLGQGLVALIKGWDLFSTFLGPAEAYTVAAGLEWFLLTLLWALALRASSARYPLFVVAEATVAAALLSKLFAGHREGNINQPFFLVDPLWSKGYDPMPAFLALGAILAAVVVVLAQAHGSRGRRGSFRDAAVAVALIGLAFAFAPIRSLRDLPTPPSGVPFEQVSENMTSEKSYAEKDEQSFKDRENHRGNPPMAVVVFEQDYEPPTGTYYFRQSAYSLYREGQLVVDPSGRFDRDLASEFPTESSMVEAEEIGASISLEVDTTVSLLSQHSRPFGLINAIEMSPAVNPDPSRFRTSYKVRSKALNTNLLNFLKEEVGSKDWDEETRSHYLETPSDPRYGELADRIVEERLVEKYHQNPVARALVSKFWLDEHGVYCLKTKHAQSQDPVSDFLFGDLTGYCVYFANAACYLYRAQGVPSRVVGGYAVPADNLGSGAALLVGGRYAHAWPEIYVEGAGWIPLDINPAKTLEDPVPPPDQNLQQLLGEMARKKSGAPTLPGDRPKLNLQALARNGVGRVVSALPWVFLLLFSILQMAKFRQHWLARSGPLQRLPVLTYRGLLQRLAELGLLREVGETRREFAQRNLARCPSLNELTDIHLRETLGPGAEPLEREDYARLYRQARQELQKDVPLWRRFLAHLDPISWWRAR